MITYKRTRNTLKLSISIPLCFLLAKLGSWNTDHGPFLSCISEFPSSPSAETCSSVHPVQAEEVEPVKDVKCFEKFFFFNIKVLKQGYILPEKET